MVLLLHALRNCSVKLRLIGQLNSLLKRKVTDMLNYDPKLTGIRIMQKRKEKGLTQDQLSKKLNISKNHISNIERGNNVPTLSFLINLCNVLGETPDYYILGIISDKTNEIENLIRQLPQSEQKTVLTLLETYINCLHNR